MHKNNKYFNVLSLLVSIVIALLSSNTVADVISSNESPDIIEPAGTYDQGGLNVLNMTVTTVIGSGSCVPGDYSGCTLNDVLNDIDGSDDFKPEVNVHMIADDFPDDGLVSNATIRLRGLTSRADPQKSFRIKLNSKKDLWRSERRIQLIKAMYDFPRIRNKLSYDLFSEIPHLPSMRTQFVHLNIIDQGTAEDYGLYTHVEHFGKEYLKRRGWHKNSRVYKAEEFEFYESPDLAIDPVTGVPLDLNAFESVLEIKRGDVHFNLANMLRDLNDPSIDFNTQIMGKYFNRDNYLTWFAVNILVNNYDTNFHNYYLFNPKANEHFYLVPWDYDLAFGRTLQDPEYGSVDQLPRWWFSHASWWNVLLHKRFLSEPGNLELLKLAVTEIKNKYLSPAQIQAKTDSYYNLVFPILTQSPDWDYIYVPGNTNPERIAEFNRVFSDLSNNVEENYARFMETANDPMPFWLNEPNFLANKNIKFTWTASKSLLGQTIVYDLEIATTKEFKSGTIIRSISDLSATSYTLHWTHPKGIYYFRVRAKDVANPAVWQEAGNYGLEYDNGMELYGVRKFVVTNDGDPPAGEVSNPVTSIQIDGDAVDWSSLTLFPQDPDDIPATNSNVIDYKSAGIAHNADTVYFLYENYGPVNPSQNSGNSIPWGWSVFIDTDKNQFTGFKYSDVLGAEYLIVGNKLYKYTGSGTNWSWSHIHTSTLKYKSNTVELGFSRGLLGNPQSMHIIFQGVNEAYGGNTIDYYPDGADNDQLMVRYFSYSFGSTGSTNHAPITHDQNLSVEENTASNINLVATDSDGDALTLEILNRPTHGTLNLTSSSLFVKYTPNQNYIGLDSFTYRVTDGKVYSNTSTVSLNVIQKPPSVISNHVAKGAITVNGSKVDWSSLRLFSLDADDVGTDTRNVINWRQAAIAHSSDTVYLLFENYGAIDPLKYSGTVLSWGWQVFIDIDNSIATGFDVTTGMGADYMLEGNHIFKYLGSTGHWSWVEIGLAKVSFKNNIAELEFPRSLLSAHSTIKVKFYGNNRAFGGSVRDKYPDSGGFKYTFGPGKFGTNATITERQKGVVFSPESHQPVVDSVKGSLSKGGSFSWLMLLPTLLLFRRKFMR